MNVPTDIASLFQLFGGQAERYKDISSEQWGCDTVKRWPEAGKRVESAPHPAASLSLPNAHSRAPSDDLPATQIADESVWSSQTLQALLAELSLPQPDTVLASVSSTPDVRSALEHLHVVALVSAKGGVGKSTLTANLATTLHHAGRSVLAIDLDPQNALCQHLPIADDMGASQTGLAMQQSVETPPRLCSSGGVQLLPYGLVNELRRREFEQAVAADPRWLGSLLASMNLAEDTLVLIDTPPGPSVYLEQVLAVANIALVVSLADAASYTALQQIESLIETYTHAREDFHGCAYVINQVDESRKLSRDISHIMQGVMGERLLGLVNSDPVIAEALAYNRSVLEHQPHGMACDDFTLCAQALLARLSVHSFDRQTA